MNSENLKREIHKVKVWHVALLCAGVFIAFAIIGSILLALGGGWHLGQMSFGFGTLYDVNDVKTVDAAGAESIAISSVSDKVIVLSGGDKITAELKGQCRGTNGPVTLETSTSGGKVTIEVRYPHTISNSDTTLTVTVPASYAGDFSVRNVSGGIEGEALPFSLKQVTLNTVSGKITFGSAAWTTLRAGTISGDVDLAGIAAPVTVETTSGSVSLDYAAFAETKVSSVSGSVNAAVPGNAAFHVDFGTVSGSFRSTLPGLGDAGSDRGFSGTANGGTTQFRVNTTSGSFRIEGK